MMWAVLVAAIGTELLSSVLRSCHYCPNPVFLAIAALLTFDDTQLGKLVSLFPNPYSCRSH